MGQHGAAQGSTGQHGAAQGSMGHPESAWLDVSQHDQLQGAEVADQLQGAPTAGQLQASCMAYSAKR